MKYIKTYEEIEEPYLTKNGAKWLDVEVGDYVILTDFNNSLYNKFIENNIAKIKKVYHPGAWFEISFDVEIPEKINKVLNSKDFIFNVANITYKSKNREELDALIKAKKFNL